MKTITDNQLFFLKALAEIRPATANQLSTFVKDTSIKGNTPRNALETLCATGLVRRYRDPVVPKRTSRERELNPTSIRSPLARSAGRRPWIYETTLAGVMYLEGSKICEKALELADPVEFEKRRSIG